MASKDFDEQSEAYRANSRRMHAALNAYIDNMTSKASEIFDSLNGKGDAEKVEILTNLLTLTYMEKLPALKEKNEELKSTVNIERSFWNGKYRGAVQTASEISVKTTKVNAEIVAQAGVVMGQMSLGYNPTQTSALRQPQQPQLTFSHAPAPARPKLPHVDWKKISSTKNCRGCKEGTQHTTPCADSCDGKKCNFCPFKHNG